MKLRRKHNRIGIAQIFLLYWGALVAWQNISGAQARSGADLALKIGLISALSTFFVLRATAVSKNIFGAFFLALSLLLSLWISDDAMTFGNFVAYMYPVLLAFLSFTIGNSFQIDKKELSYFLNGIILIALYAAVYSMLFCMSELLIALQFKRAYGVEVSSFFTSSHEYAMYLLYAIMACIICIEMNKGSGAKKLRYFVAMVIFIPNLVLTFSRSAMLAMVVILLGYAFISAREEMRKWIILFLVMMAVAFFVSESFRDVIELLAFKKMDSLGSREALLQLAFDTFADGTIPEKLFGHGLGVRSLFEREAAHGSVHNAYLQVLLYFGLVGLAFMLLLLLSQLIANIRLYRKAKFYSATFCVLLLSAMALMFTDTTIVFTSSIDSFFLTVIVILVPKYVRNAIYNGVFE